MNDDIHDDLIHAYLNYFKAKDAFDRLPSYRKYWAIQQEVRKIRNLALLREKELRKYFKNAQKQRKRKK